MSSKIYKKMLETPIGTIGLWGSEKGLSRILLPEKSKSSLIEKLDKQTQGLCAGIKRPTWSSDVEEMLLNFLRGVDVNFKKVPLDFKASVFQQKVYEKLKEVPYGSRVSYKELACLIGNENAARAVGTAMKNNPVPIIIPCHRVVSSKLNFLGGFSAYEGTKLKEKLLKLERYKQKLY